MKQTQQENYNKYDDQVQDVDEIEGTDVKINPDYYIHLSLVSALKSLERDDLRQALIFHRLYIEQAETLASAGNYLSPDYYDALEDFKKNDVDYNDDKKEEYARQHALAKKKEYLILKEVFSNKVAVDALKIGKEKIKVATNP